MKVMFIQDNGINESLALCELSAYLKANGHETKLLLEKEEKDLFSKVAEYSPDWFLIPCSILAHNWALNIAKSLRERFNKLVVLGGTHPTFYPEIIEEDSVDAIIKGEAEGASLDICEALACGGDIAQIKNVTLKRDGKIIANPLRHLIDPLDSLPVSDREMYFGYPFIRNFGWKKFMSGRGCCHSCSYCYNPAIRENYKGLGPYVRRKSPARMIEEITLVKNTSKLTAVHFSDDLFTSQPSWLEEFGSVYKREIGVPFTCNSTVDLVNERSVAALKNAGCRAVAIGIETGDDSIRRTIMGKNITDEQIRNAARLIKESGMLCATFNMIGNPGETIASAFKTMELNASIGADCPRLTFAMPFPKTPFAEYAVGIGALSIEEAGRLPDLTDISRKGPGPVFKTSRPWELTNLYYLFRVGVTFPAFIPLIKILVKLRLTPLFKPLAYYAFYMEKKLFNLGLIEGYLYYRHTGPPDRRTTNFVSLI